MAPHSGKVCVKKILKLDVANAGLAACCIEASQRSVPLHRPVILKSLTLLLSYCGQVTFVYIGSTVSHHPIAGYTYILENMDNTGI